MNGIWISSLRGNMSCGSCKISSTDAAAAPTLPQKSSSDFQESKSRHHYNKNRFLELEVGDPSRKVIEMIFRASSTNPRKCKRKIKRVIKVNNSVEIVDKFETYREGVMVLSCSEEQKRRQHPRSVVDGNELLQFYGTTINCCTHKMYSSSSHQLCTDASCRVCTIIQSGFNTSYNKINGIRLSTKSDGTSEDLHVSNKAKRAVIICRTIAGGIMDGGRLLIEEQEGSFGDDESMVVRNPAAVLPCFVIVF